MLGDPACGESHACWHVRTPPSRDYLDNLFCEPFPGSTWILPQRDFPVRRKLTIDTAQSLGNTLSRGEALGGAPWLYLHLVHNYHVEDRRFFCDDVQAELRRVPWFVFHADNYFVPGLFQVRNFKWAPISIDEFYGQILRCTHRENILPGVVVPRANITVVGSGGQAAKCKAVVVVSLHGEYSERLRDMYHENCAASGEAVTVFQLMHLGEQHFGDRQQNHKALAEMVLLSFSDVLVTTAVSTFGYVSQGLRPWVLTRPNHGKAPQTACRLAPSIEPCFHTPPNYDCQAKAGGDSGRMVQHTRHCEDFEQGVQLLES
ncbi:Galactoside 2-alpha-L-fucosyltransferase [Dichanthelium oligosanthes]|uniref:Fucosyltransferase n=1 Tax=Dichanthelium oligosanthes TaxID=888268 RepID=A0A1E5US55_9POAL|nr:Galactoside 2-alpha-L-fucosyltransferase [Dichanthelium oligosanthes]